MYCMLFNIIEAKSIFFSNVHLLKENIKLNKNGALLILRNEIWSFLSLKSYIRMVHLYLHQYYKYLAVLVLK